MSQWFDSREGLFSWHSTKKVSSVPSLAHRMRSEAWTNPRFALEFSEITKLVHMAYICPDSTAECERITHTARRDMTKERTAMVLDKYKACEKKSDESRRRNGVEQKHKLVQIFPQAQSFLTKYRAERSEKVRASKIRALAAPQNKQSEQSL